MAYLLGILTIFFLSCFNANILVLSKTQLAPKDLANRIIEIDTIEAHPERGIYIVNIITNGTFGRFSMNYAIIKKANSGNDMVYLMKTKDSISLRVSKDYISLVKFSDNGWGWFYKKSGMAMGMLPMIDEILDSVKSVDNNKPFYITESNGNIFFNLNGKPVKSINCGNIITKFKNKNFDSLDYKLYRLTGDSLTIISNNGNDLVKQQDGIFYIPKPGFGVIEKFDKTDIFKAFDSILNLRYPSATLEFKATQ